MTPDYKRILALGISLTMSAAAVAPVAVLAVQEQNASSTAQKNLCETLSASAAKVSLRLGEKADKLKEKRTEIQNKIRERQIERDNKLIQKQTKWDTNRSEHFAKLEEKAGSDAEKQALLVFERAVSAAIGARRAAIGAANKVFQDGVKQASAARKASLDAAVAAFQNAIKAAYEKAKTDCAAGTDIKTVRGNLKTALQAARDKLNSDRQAIEKAKSMETLIQAHKAVIKKANDDFKAAMEKAKVDFKAAIAKISSSPSVSSSASPSVFPSSSPSASPSVSASPSPGNEPG